MTDGPTSPPDPNDDWPTSSTSDETGSSAPDQGAPPASGDTDSSPPGEPSAPSSAPSSPPSAPSSPSSPPSSPPSAPSSPPSSPSSPTPPRSPAAQPQTGTGTQDQRNWAMGAHLSALVASFVGLALLGPLVVYLIKKDEDPFVAEHSREALNFQITWLVAGVVGGIVGFIIGIVTLGLGFVILALVGFLFAVAWLAFIIIAAVKASNGEHYRYPLTVRLVS